MRVAVLGTGMVGRTLAPAITAAGNDVTIGTRDVAQLLESNADFATWHREHPSVVLDSFSTAAKAAELVVNATSGAVSLDALGLVGAANLAGKVLVDVSNPLDFSGGMPPTLTVANTDSLGEQIQRAFPDALVVKTLNTVNADLMVRPEALDGGNHDAFLCGNDEQARSLVAGLLREWFGWRSVLDLGDITAARGMEMYLPLWLRVMAAVGSAAFNVKVVQ